MRFHPLFLPQAYKTINSDSERYNERIAQLEARPKSKIFFFFFCCNGFVFADEYLFSVCLSVNLSSSVKRNNLHRQLGLDSHSEFFITGFIELMGAASQACFGMCVFLQFLGA